MIGEPATADPADVARKKAAAPTLKLPPDPEWELGEDVPACSQGPTNQGGMDGVHRADGDGVHLLEQGVETVGFGEVDRRRAASPAADRFASGIRTQGPGPGAAGTSDPRHTPAKQSTHG